MRRNDLTESDLALELGHHTINALAPSVALEVVSAPVEHSVLHVWFSGDGIDMATTGGPRWIATSEGNQQVVVAVAKGARHRGHQIRRGYLQPSKCC